MKPNVRVLREAANLTQEQLGVLVGRDQHWVSRLERSSRPRVDDLALVARALSLELVSVIVDADHGDLLTLVAQVPRADVPDAHMLLTLWSAMDPDMRDALVTFLSKLHAKIASSS